MADRSRCCVVLASEVVRERALCLSTSLHRPAGRISGNAPAASTPPGQTAADSIRSQAVPPLEHDERRRLPSVCPGARLLVAQRTRFARAWMGALSALGGRR